MIFTTESMSPTYVVWLKAWALQTVMGRKDGHSSYCLYGGIFPENVLLFHQMMSKENAAGSNSSQKYNLLNSGRSLFAKLNFPEFTAQLTHEQAQRIHSLDPCSVGVLRE